MEATRIEDSRIDKVVCKSKNDYCIRTEYGVFIEPISRYEKETGIIRTVKVMTEEVLLIHGNFTLNKEYEASVELFYDLDKDYADYLLLVDDQGDIRMEHINNIKEILQRSTPKERR